MLRTLLLVVRSTEKLACMGGSLLRRKAGPFYGEINAGAVDVACMRAIHLIDGLTRLQLTWKRMLGDVRADSALAKLLPLLVAHPVLSVGMTQRRLNVSNEAARLALIRPEELGVLQEKMGTGYARVWSADEVFQLLDDFDFAIDGSGWPEK